MSARKQQITAIIPARGGSKGLPGKAFMKVGGLSLIGHAARCALESRYIGYALVSTDCPKIACEANKHGLDAPFMRPPELAGDSTPMLDVLVHALENLPRGVSPDIVVLLQPTSPLRTAATVDACIERFIASGADSAATVTRAKITPFWMRTADGEGRLRKLPGYAKDITDRQSAPGFFHFNGAVYITRSELVTGKRTILGPEPLALETTTEEGIDIDTRLDLELARCAFRLRAAQTKAK